MRDIHSFGAHRHAAKLRAHSGQEVLEAGVDRVLDRYGVAGPKQHAADQIERLLATIGDDQVVAGTGHILPPRLLHEVAAQRFVSAGRAELQDAGQVMPGQHGAATGAKIVQRKQVARRARDGEADDFLAPSGRWRGRRTFAPLKQRIPRHTAPGGKSAGDEASFADLA